MNPCSSHFKHFARFRLLTALLSVVFILVATEGCYEGYKKPGGGAGAGGNGKLTDANKPYGLAILDVIQPSDAALTDSRCSNVPAALAEIRKSEMTARFESVRAIVDAKAELVHQHITSIWPEDCSRFTALEARAKEDASNDWPDDYAKYKSKPVLHVRLILWYGDRSRQPVPQFVTSNIWADVQALINDGFTRTLSVNNFALTQEGWESGYMNRWLRNSEFSLNYTSKTIVHPIPTDDGLRQIANSVTQSGKEFSAWLLTRTNL